MTSVWLLSHTVYGTVTRLLRTVLPSLCAAAEVHREEMSRDVEETKSIRAAVFLTSYLFDHNAFHFIKPIIIVSYLTSYIIHFKSLYIFSSIISS